MDRLFHIMDEGVGQVRLAAQYPLKCNLLKQAWSMIKIYSFTSSHTDHK